MATEPSSSATLAANPSEWSEASQRTAAAGFVSEYKDNHDKCWHCQASSLFTAADQKHTCAVRKDDINCQRLLCQACWRRFERDRRRTGGLCARTGRVEGIPQERQNVPILLARSTARAVNVCPSTARSRT